MSGEGTIHTTTAVFTDNFIVDVAEHKIHIYGGGLGDAFAHIPGEIIVDAITLEVIVIVNLSLAITIFGEGLLPPLHRTLEHDRENHIILEV